MNRLRGLFNLFEKKTELLQLLDAGRRGQGIHIFVGSESGLASLDECSVVTAPYSADGQSRRHARRGRPETHGL